MSRPGDPQAVRLPCSVRHSPGCNIGLSNTLVIQSAPATFGPTLVNSNDTDGVSRGQTFRTVNLQFSEPLRSVEFRMVDLAGLYLGMTAGNIIWIDQNAAGHGWFVDSTPDDDEEFVITTEAKSGLAAAGSAADGKVDLLTVVMHELGHVLGLDHLDELDDLLFESLAAGQRKRLSSRELDWLFAKWGE